MGNMRKCGLGPPGLEWRAAGRGLYVIGFGTPTSQPSPPYTQGVSKTETCGTQSEIRFRKFLLACGKWVGRQTRDRELSMDRCQNHALG